MSLGGILLCMTGKCLEKVAFPVFHACDLLLFLYVRLHLSGSEAMYADLGHFSQLSIKVKYRISHCYIVF